MGTIVNRGDKHRAVVRMAGHKPQTKTFDSRKDAKDWISDTETALREKARAAPAGRNIATLSVSEVLRKYCTDVLAKKGYKVDCSHQERFARDFEGVEFGQLSHAWWIKTITGWNVKPGSAQRYVMALASAFKAAEDLQWGVAVDWVSFHDAMKAATRQKLIGNSRQRTRRVSDEELNALKATLTQFNYEIPLADLLDMAIASAMRVGEICRVTWADLDQRRKMLWVRDRKDPKKKLGNDHEIPLLGDALAILQRQPKTDARIFPYHPATISHAFTLMAKWAKVKGIRFHDLRHEAITRLFEAGYAIDEVALVSGHTKWETLRGYTHVKPDSLHKGPRQMRAAA